MSYVLLIDQDKRPLDPVHPGRARTLLSTGQAAVYRRYPFVLILTRRVPGPHMQPFRLKIDPGSKTTGLAVVNDASGQVVWAAELAHRGEQVRTGLLTRRRARRGRRHRHTRYRQPRWRNRRRRAGWLAPSLLSRLQNVLTWVERLRRFCPVGAISFELVRFDLQLLQNPDIEGLEYQRGTLFGTELRHYLLTKWQQRCAYCSATGIPLEIDHVQPRAKGGSDRVSNLVIACHPCNQAKGDQPLEMFLADRPEVLRRVQAQRRVPLRDAAVVKRMFPWHAYVDNAVML
jgi:5-methylcytosine-specific restriction endonuclease McrA